MEVTLFFTFLLLPLSLSLIFFLFRKRGQPGLNVPPGSSGWPLVGENIQFALLGPQRFIKDKMDKFSPDVFQTSILGEKMAVFCGAQGNKFLFTNESKILTSWWPESMKKALLFPEFYNNSLKDVSALQRGFLHDILKPEALKQYIPVMDEMAQQHLDDDWKPNDVVKVFPLAKNYTFALACRLFMSIVEPEEIKRLADPFLQVTNGMFSVPINLPGTAYSGAIRGGEMVRKELMRIITTRSRELSLDTKTTDLLSKMLAMVTDNNDSDNDSDDETKKKKKMMMMMEISNNIIGMLVASYETTSSAVTFVLKHLADFPHVYDGVFKEQMEIAKSKGADELLSWEDIEKMKYSWNVARESLRVTPPAQGAFREITTDCTFAGFTIPKGWKTFWTVHSTHKNPKYFPDPEKFDPSRFEGSGPPPYTFTPFGGGPRMCPGKEYARLEVLVFMHNVVKRYKLQRANPNEKIVFHPSPTPIEGLPIHLIPHEN